MAASVTTPLASCSARLAPICISSRRRDDWARDGSTSHRISQNRVKVAEGQRAAGWLAGGWRVVEGWLGRGGVP